MRASPPVKEHSAEEEDRTALHLGCQEPSLLKENTNRDWMPQTETSAKGSWPFSQPYRMNSLGAVSTQELHKPAQGSPTAGANSPVTFIGLAHPFLDVRIRTRRIKSTDSVTLGRLHHLPASVPSPVNGDNDITSCMGCL